MQKAFASGQNFFRFKSTEIDPTPLAAIAPFERSTVSEKAAASIILGDKHGVFHIASGLVVWFSI